ncbi:MAG: Triosephosphate isomerase [Eubacteriales bacterium SKADARSKE-1]|nr:Triosephosphate isomerase [Eubacteriales bacterium SKADARSKE-1]
MNKLLRTPVIAGNWKMNKNCEETKNLIEEITPLVKKANCKIVLCVPYTDLLPALSVAANTNIKIGAQNCHFEDHGAFTGEISAKMLSSMGVEYVVIGHSERRMYFSETDITVNKKIKAAIKEKLNVILCVGESLEQREQNITFEVISTQLKIAFKDIINEDLEKIIVAYEPIWAIGTGKTATSEQAEEVCYFIREIIKQLYDKKGADSMSILYGGSMNAKNAKELLLQNNIDGGLIGGASLKSADFSEIVKEADA